MEEIILKEDGYITFSTPLKGSVEGKLLSLATQKTQAISPSVRFWSNFTQHFIESARTDPTTKGLREKLSVSLSKNKMLEFLHKAPFMQGGEYLNEDCLLDRWQDLQSHLSAELKSFKGSVQEYFLQLNSNIHLVGKVYFHLVENKQSDQYPFAFMATYLTNVTKEKDLTYRPLRYALEEFAEDQEKMLQLLATIKRASVASLFIKNLLDSGQIFNVLKWSPNKAQQFLKEVPLYNKAGILCRIPNWWKSASKRASTNLVVGHKNQSLLGTKSLIDFHINLSLGGVELSQQETKKLLKESDGLILLKGQWVNIDKDNLAKALDKWNQIRKLMKNQNISFSDAMKLLSGKKIGSATLDTSEVTITKGKWLKGLMDKLKSPAIIKNMTLPQQFKGTLRPYQQQGLNWLGTLHSLGLGGCLADDMGLGKTIQALAFLQKVVSKDGGLHLIILPASLVSNWANEILNFTPYLKFFIAHPSNKDFDETKLKTKTLQRDYNLVLTTYGLVRRFDVFQKINWDYVILDEAQAIKNSATSQTRSVKLLSAKNRLALTGTPIENRLSDLWSLFDFINPGILGSKTEFQKTAKKALNKEEGLSALKNTISPYILRRIKTDKSIISDLPPKIELKSYTYLSKKQAIQYQKLVKYVESSLQNTKGIQRKGLILSSLIKFKQICNHADQYLGTGNFHISGSGKFERLRDICETIFAKREKALIFTQFKEIIHPLNKFLSDLAKVKGSVLHGGTPVRKRKALVDQFQSDNKYTPYFILSLKAGGTGLNLTAANHVIHFDRWWNPAVENQATDRAFRIGQHKRVVVHKLITKGTLEEKIDKMLEEKTKMISKLIGAKSHEINFTQMSDSEIIELIKVDKEIL